MKQKSICNEQCVACPFHKKLSKELEENRKDFLEACFEAGNLLRSYTPSLLRSNGFYDENII